MSTPPTPPPAGPTPPPLPSASQAPTPTPVATPTASTPSASPTLPPNPSAPPKPLEPLQGWRGALEHTGLPRGVLLYKPRLPSRNWCIFWTVLGTVSYLYYDDRSKCKSIKEKTLERVKYRAGETLDGSLDVVRKVKVYGARWPGDDDTDRALRSFRKYVKPYLVAAAVDFEQVTAPLHGSITRQIHASILKKRRQALGLEPRDQGFSLPGIINPAEMDRRELEGGSVIIGRHTLKEYMEGLRRGWTGGVDEWDWEKSIEQELKYDGVFEKAPEPVTDLTSEADAASAVTQQPAALPGTFSFLAKAPPPAAPSAAPSAQAVIPSSYHIPPFPLPPQAPILLLPFVSHLGFKQIPSMIYDFFTERYRVQAGADAAVALIESQTRPLVHSDLEFDRDAEKWYKKDFVELPTKMQESREEYYKKLEPRLESVRQLARGERDLNDDEKKSDKPVTTEQDLIEERKKKEMRWKGQEEGFEIIRADKDVTWDDKWEGWLNIFELPKEGGPSK